MKKIVMLFMIFLGFTLLSACQSGPRKVNLYFKDKGSDYLIVEKRTIPGKNIEEETVRELMKGPEESGLAPVLPAETRLLECRMEGKVAVLNFSKEIREKHPGGSSGEAVTVYALANTMSDLPTVERIKILIEGEEVDSLLGHIYLGEEIERNENMIKK